MADVCRWVVMGVAGSGKSTLGRLLADRLNLPFIEGDDEHPVENVLKMRSGSALDDADRLPWLLRLQSRIAGARQAGNGMVLSCSALKRSYRDLLREGDPNLVFLHLAGDAALLDERLRARKGHFMPAALLDSQLLALHALAPDETGMCLDARCTPEQLIEQILRTFGEKM